jgi:hypothetical protein
MQPWRCCVRYSDRTKRYDRGGEREATALIIRVRRFDSSERDGGRAGVLGKFFGGESRIRTNVGLRQQIYSLPPLATRASHHMPASENKLWSGRRDSNSRPSAWKADALAN